MSQRSSRKLDEKEQLIRSSSQIYYRFEREKYRTDEVLKNMHKQEILTRCTTDGPVPPTIIFCPTPSPPHAHFNPLILIFPLSFLCLLFIFLPFIALLLTLFLPKSTDCYCISPEEWRSCFPVYVMYALRPIRTRF